MIAAVGTPTPSAFTGGAEVGGGGGGWGVGRGDGCGGIGDVMMRGEGKG